VYECVFNADHGLVYPSGNELIDLKVPAGGTILQKVYYFVLRCICLKTIKKKYRIDVCISHLEGADYVNLLSRQGESAILCIHGSKLHDRNIRGGLGWLRRKVLIPFLYNKADAVVTVSQAIQSELTDVMGVKTEKVRTIHNFFDHSLILDKATEPIAEDWVPLFEGGSVLITSGRLASQKNHAQLLEVMAALVKIWPCKLVIIGDGELREELVAQANRLALKTFSVWAEQPITTDFEVYFLGYQANPFKYLKRSSIFVLPSAWEGFPMALGEAMICGLPVVAADCPTGPREMLAPNTSSSPPIVEAESAAYGILMPMLNQSASNNAVSKWAKVLAALLDQPVTQESYGRKAAERMRHFSKENAMGQWEQVIS
jgi:glycosyltransferase involved in cell wall biosynthesis